MMTAMGYTDSPEPPSGPSTRWHFNGGSGFQFWRESSTRPWRTGRLRPPFPIHISVYGLSWSFFCGLSSETTIHPCFFGVVAFLLLDAWTVLYTVRCESSTPPWSLGDWSHYLLFLPSGKWCRTCNFHMYTYTCIFLYVCICTLPHLPRNWSSSNFTIPTWYQSARFNPRSLTTLLPTLLLFFKLK